MAAVFRLCCLLLLASCTSVRATHGSCESIEAVPDCMPLGECDGLECRPQSEGVSGTVSALIRDKCTDPIEVDVSISVIRNGVNVTYQNTLTDSMNVEYSENVSLVVEISRSDSYLYVQVALLDSATETSEFIIPNASLPLESHECACQSLQSITNTSVDSTLVRNCTVLPNCEGLICELDVLGDVYYFEVIVLACESPPMVEWVLKNDQMQSIFVEDLSQGSSGPQPVGHTSLMIDWEVFVHEYSLDIQIALVDHFTGRTDLIPSSTIILDRSNCSVTPTIPPVITVAPPTDTPTPPPNADQTCLALYALANTSVALEGLIFSCVPNDYCDTLECRLSFVTSTYGISLRLSSCYAPPFSRVLVLSDDGMEIGSMVVTEATYFVVELPNPEGSKLDFVLSTTSESIGFQLYLEAPINSQTMVISLVKDTLVPYTCSDGVVEECQALVEASQNNPSCEAIGNCSGLQCQLQTFSGYSSFTVDKCRDPVAVLLRVVSTDFDFEGEYLESGSMEYEGVEIHVGMLRNFTHLDVNSYMLVEGDIAVLLIPQVSVPLNSTECACQSFEELAAITVSPVEHDCQVVENCRGVECELDVFGSIYYVEYLVDPCGDDVVIDYIIYNDEMEALVVESYNETTSTTIVVDGTSIPIQHILIRHDYSIIVETYITVAIFLRINIIPRHTIILDFTQCDNPVTLPPLVTSSPPIPTISTPPKDASQTCLALYSIANNTNAEPFLCGVHDDCGGLQCVLDLTYHMYDVTVDINPCDSDKEPSSLSIVVSEGTTVHYSRTADTTQTFPVDLPDPPGSKLWFLADFDTWKDSFAIEIELEFVDISDDHLQRNITLIPTAVILNLECSEKDESGGLNERGRVAVGVTSTAILIALALVSVLVVTAVCVVYKRAKKRKAQFDFRSMENPADLPVRYGDLVEGDEKGGEEMEGGGKGGDISLDTKV